MNLGSLYLNNYKTWHRFLEKIQQWPWLFRRAHRKATDQLRACGFMSGHKNKIVIRYVSSPPTQAAMTGPWPPWDITEIAPLSGQVSATIEPNTCARPLSLHALYILPRIIGDFFLIRCCEGKCSALGEWGISDMENSWPRTLTIHFGYLISYLRRKKFDVGLKYDTDV